MHSFKEVKMQVIVTHISSAHCSLMCQSAAPVAFNYLFIFILYSVLKNSCDFYILKWNGKKKSVAFNRMGRISGMIEQTQSEMRDCL